MNLPSVDAFEVAILAFFLVALGFCLYNLKDAWANELTAIDNEDSGIALLGLEDLGRAALALAMGAVPGVVLGISLFTVPSPLNGEQPASPQELVAAIVFRVVLLLFGSGLLMSASLSYWLRRRMRRRREAPPGVPPPTPDVPAEATPPGRPVLVPEGSGT